MKRDYGRAPSGPVSEGEVNPIARHAAASFSGDSDRGLILADGGHNAPLERPTLPGRVYSVNSMTSAGFFRGLLVRRGRFAGRLRHPEIGISFDPVVRDITHSRIQGEQIALTGLDRGG